MGNDFLKKDLENTQSDNVELEEETVQSVEENNNEQVKEKVSLEKIDSDYNHLYEEPDNSVNELKSDEGVKLEKSDIEETTNEVSLSKDNSVNEFTGNYIEDNKVKEETTNSVSKSNSSNNQTLSIASLIVSILGFFGAFFLGVFVLPVSIAAIIMSGISFRKSEKGTGDRTMSLIGLIIGIVTTVFVLIITGFFLLILFLAMSSGY